MNKNIAVTWYSLLSLGSSLSLLLLALALSGCSSQSVLSRVDDVKVSREKPSSACDELGKVTGSTSSVRATNEDALADMKQAAANKGANYLMVQQYSDSGGSVTGVAYKCP